MPSSLNSKQYQYLLFDADGTLFDYEKAETNALKKTCYHYKIIFSSQVHDKYREINKKMFDAYENKQITIDELKLKRFSIWANELGLNIDSRSFSSSYLKNLSNETHLLPNVSETLKILSGKYKMSIITNGIGEVQRKRISKSGIGEYFENLIISGEIGVSKPDPLFFEKTISIIGNPSKNNVLVIGDSLSSDITGGNSYGIDTCWLNLKVTETERCTIPSYTISGIEQLIDILCP